MQEVKDGDHKKRILLKRICQRRNVSSFLVPNLNYEHCTGMFLSVVFLLARTTKCYCKMIFTFFSLLVTWLNFLLDAYGTFCQ